MPHGVASTSIWALLVVLGLNVDLSCFATSNTDLVDRTKEFPDLNICVYEDYILKMIFDCVIERMSKEVIDYFKRMLSQIFPDLTMVEAVRLICKSNNDDGHMIVEMTRELHGDDVITQNLGAVWSCYDDMRDILLSN